MRAVQRFVLVLCTVFCGCGRADFGPPVVEAAAFGQLGRLRALLEQGAAADARDRSGFTPLMHAARQGHLEALALLVGAGADPDLASGRNGWTPLLHAVHKNQAQAVEALLRLGAHVDGPSASGLTPLIMAAGYGQTRMVALLLQHDADVWTSARKGETPLLAAVKGVPDIDCFTLGSCQNETVRLLLQHDPTLHRQADALGPLVRFYVRHRCPAVAAMLWERRGG